MANTKVTLTITIPEDIHKKLKRIVGLGRVSEFVSKAIEKDLLEREEKIVSDSTRGETKIKSSKRKWRADIKSSFGISKWQNFWIKAR